MSIEAASTDLADTRGKPLLSREGDSAESTTEWRHRAARIWERTDQLLFRAGDWFNPILVKETRQSLKSYHFTVTFLLLLIACWVVTIGGVAVIGPRIYYSADGGTLLWWYYAVLAFPLIVVVPYSAYRSLTAEREDSTYELLSITALKPRQIISGKLASAVLQMVVYFSAVTPCVAFTYLLRGIDMPTIAVLLAYSFFASLGLSMVGILVASISQQRYAQVIVSVALVALLLCCYYFSLAVIGGGTILFNFSAWAGPDFWIGAAVLGTLYVTFFALAFLAATALITFTSENRSTPLRIAMVVQQAAFVGWMALLWISAGFELWCLSSLATTAAIYWYIMGAMITSERLGMSERVKRKLPRSDLGRMLFSWLNPGPASGYMFVVANGTTIIILCFLGLAFTVFTGKSPGAWPTAEELSYLLVIGWSYVVAYLGLGMLVVAAVRRVAVVSMLASVLIHFLVLLAGSGIPTAIQLMSVELRFVEYSRMQIMNPIWSLKHLSEGGIPFDGKVLLTTIPTIAICMLMLNMRSVLQELQAVRIAPPQRVLDDEAELHPVAAELPANPWDEA